MKFIVLILMLVSFSQGSIYKNTKYDMYFKKEYNKYFKLYKGIYSWKIIKAQSIQESRLKPTAKSYVGAYGLMQIMPKTEIELKKQLNINAKNAAGTPKLAIKMGVYYNYRLFKMWRSKRTLESRYKLMFASYNAGAGHLINAQKLCIKKNKPNCNEYGPIEEQLHKITGHHSNETKTYIKRIFKYYKRLLFI